MDHTYTFDIMLFFQNKKGFFHVTFMFYFFHILIDLAYDFFLIKREFRRFYIDIEKIHRRILITLKMLQ